MFLLALGWITGCSRYEPQPLSATAVEQQLNPPEASALKVAAGQISHPILKPVTIDLDQGLSPQEAGVLAVIINPQLRAERNGRSIASAQLLQAGLLPNPTLTAGVDFPHHSDPPDNFIAYNAGLDWEVTSLLSHDAKVRAASAQLKSVELDVAWKEWQFAQAAKTAAVDVIALQLQLESAREADQRLSENLKLIRHAVEQHQRTLLDESAAEVAAQDAHSAVLGLQKDLNHQTLLLNQALGVPPKQHIALRREGALPSSLHPPAFEELVDGLDQHRLDLLALRQGYESQEATLRVAVIQQFPKINVGFNAARDTSDVQTFGLGVSIDIPVFDRNQGNIAIETATRQKLFDEYTSRVFTARSDIATAIADIESINEQIDAAEAAIPGLERLVQTYEAELQQRNVDILSFYTARSTLATKRVELIKLKQQLAESWIALEIASGTVLPPEGGGQ